GVHRARVVTEPALTQHALDARPPTANNRPDARPAPPQRAVRVTRSSGDLTSNDSQRRPWIYVKHALMHPWHVVVLAGATVFGVANWSLMVLLLVFAGAELLLLGIVLHL